MAVAAMQIADMMVCAAIVAPVDTAPILKPAEHDLDFVTLPIEGSVVRDCHLPICL